MSHCRLQRTLNIIPSDWKQMPEHTPTSDFAMNIHLGGAGSPVTLVQSMVIHYLTNHIYIYI